MPGENFPKTPSTCNATGRLPHHPACPRPLLITSQLPPSAHVTVSIPQSTKTKPKVVSPTAKWDNENWGLPQVPVPNG